MLSNTCHHRLRRTCLIIHKMKKTMEPLVTGLRVLVRVLGDGWKMNSSPEVTSSGPQGREGSIGAWKGDVVSDGCWDCNSSPLHTAVLQPSWGATQALISRIQSISWGCQAPAAWWLSFSLLSCALYLLSLEHIHTHTCTHFLSCFLLLCPCVITDSFSSTAPHPFRACHSLPQDTGDCSMPFTPT